MLVLTANFCMINQNTIRINFCIFNFCMTVRWRSMPHMVWSMVMAGKSVASLVQAMVRGYHIYEDIYTAIVGEEFLCKREINNIFNPFAMVVMRGDTVCCRNVPLRLLLPFSLVTLLPASLVSQHG